MSDQFVAEIRLFPFSFAPTGWALCHGQLLPISQNTALFSLLGTYYGGDGESTFALPDLQGNVAMHHGRGQALSERFLGEASGSETVTLLQSEIPSHGHTLRADNQPAIHNRPAGDRVLAASVGGLAYVPANGFGEAPSPALASPMMLAQAGGDLPHNNMQPYLTLNYCIALQGIFPPARMTITLALATRPATGADEVFLRALFVSSRPFDASGLAAVPGLLEMQYAARDRSHAAAYPTRRDEIVLVDGEPVGRLLTAGGHVVDLAIVPSNRGEGIGTLLLERLLSEGPVTLEVAVGNPALRLYERLGFTTVGSTDTDLTLQHPGHHANEGAGA